MPSKKVLDTSVYLHGNSVVIAALNSLLDRVTLNLKALAEVELIEDRNRQKNGSKQADKHVTETYRF